MSTRRKPRFIARDGETPDRLLNPPCRRKRPFLLFHWAPTSRRASILRHGLRIGRKVVAHSGPEPADYLCFCEWPGFGWALSAAVTDKTQEWDLWTVRSDLVPGRLTYRSDHKGQTPAELRAWQDIPLNAVAYVASKWHRPGRSGYRPAKRPRRPKSIKHTVDANGRAHVKRDLRAWPST